MKAAGYCRVSTEEQAAEGHSLAAQRRQIRAAAEARGWELVDLFVDAGFTGANTDRPGLQQLLALGRAHGLDVVIITDLDRLSRNPRDVYMMLDDYFAENGLALYAIGQGLDSTTPMGRAMIGIASVFARLERDLLSERTKRGMAEAKAQKSGGLLKMISPNLVPAFQAMVARVYRQKDLEEALKAQAERRSQLRSRSRRRKAPLGRRRLH